MLTQKYVKERSLLAGKKTALLLLLLALPIFGVTAQVEPNPFIPTNSPQWVKDLRRWNIVAFGSFPFTMFTATFAMDMHRWSSTNGMDFSDEGRRYAPWPLKSAGAIAMERSEQEMTITIAAGLSIAVAMADLIIAQVKRNRARRRAEALPVGTTIITRTPWPEEPEAGEAVPAEGEEEIEEAVPETP